MTKRVLLSFDVEDFDLPSEYGLPISPEEGIGVTSEGLIGLLDLLRKSGYRSDLFCNGKLCAGPVGLGSKNGRKI